MKCYADSSFITAFYVNEPFTPKAQKLGKDNCPFLFTPWHRLEVRNAIRCAVSTERAKASIQLLEQDLREETVLFHHAIDWTDCLRRAEELSKNHNPQVGASSSDLFHVACALEMGFEEFFSFDRRQTDLAKAVGLKAKGL